MALAGWEITLMIIDIILIIAYGFFALKRKQNWKYWLSLFLFVVGCVGLFNDALASLIPLALAVSLVATNEKITQKKQQRENEKKAKKLFMKK